MQFLCLVDVSLQLARSPKQFCSTWYSWEEKQFPLVWPVVKIRWLFHINHMQPLSNFQHKQNFRTKTLNKWHNNMITKSRSSSSVAKPLLVSDISMNKWALCAADNDRKCPWSATPMSLCMRIMGRHARRQWSHESLWLIFSELLKFNNVACQLTPLLMHWSYCSLALGHQYGTQTRSSLFLQISWYLMVAGHP